MRKQVQLRRFKAEAGRPAGFSLIELLIVIAIILIIAAIAIPSLLHAKISANQSSAVGSLRAIATAEVTYSTAYGSGYGTLAQLGTPSVPCTPSAAADCLLDPLLSGGTKSGYTFTVTPSGLNNSSYAAGAVPVSLGLTGQNTYCDDETGVLRFDVTGSAAPATDTACEVLPAVQ